MNSNDIEKITKMDEEKRNYFIRVFSKLGLVAKLDVCELQRNLFHKIRINYPDVHNSVLTLCSLILAIQKVVKNMDTTQYRALKIRGSRKSSQKKRQKLLSYWSIVKQLREQEKMSFREIEKYFAKYHMDVSYSTIYGLWVELESNKMEEK